MSRARIMVGDCREMLRTLPDESVHCCVTSPPYWGLRDYGVDGQLGLEETPEEYVETMVAVFREVRRVLRDDGTLWLNLGDSYAGRGGFSPDAPSNRAGSKQTTIGGGAKRTCGLPVVGHLKPKDLVGIPWRVAFALQADGWWLRSDIIWSKPNPMPESVTDRPTKAHEYLFLLSKSERYYYDAEAIAEEATDPEYRTVGKVRPSIDAHAVADPERGRTKMGLSSQEGGRTKRNRRTVWEITTRPYPEAHFAVYPPELVEPCILAGTSAKGACVECGAPWERETEEHDDPRTAYKTVGTGPYGQGSGRGDGADRPNKVLRADGRGGDLARKRHETVGWQPTCEFDADDVVPCTVLDPFAGSGTTGMVATGHGRDAILIDLNPEYAEMMKKRVGPMFVEVA